MAGFCLACAFITFGLGVYVIARNPGSLVNRLFLLSMLLAAYWALGEFLIWQVRTPENIGFYLKASSFWPMVIAVFIHFIVVYCGHPLSRKDNSWALIMGIYAPSLALSLIGLLTDDLYTVIFREGYGYVYTPVIGSNANLLESSYILAVMLLSLFVVFISWKSETRGKEAYQKRLVGLGVLTVIASGALSALVLPALGIYTPNMVFLGIAVFSLLMAYAIHTQGLFVVTPEMAMSQIMALIPDAIVITDGTGKITDANEAVAGILGIPREDVSGRDIGEVFGGKSSGSLMDTVLRRGRVTDIEAEIDGGQHRVVSISGARVNNPEGGPAGIVLVIRDITGRKARESALRIANEKISLLTRLTRHDISNLVTALSGYLELMRGDCDRYINPAIQTVQRITEYLQFSKQYQDIGSTRPEWQPLAGIVARAIGEIHAEGLEITVDVPDVEIFADALVYRVIYALIDNTIRHSGGATKVRISTEKGEDNALTVVFEDNGRGIGEKDKELIFQYGYGSHTGLGLAISRDILALTGLDVKETGVPGKGARFEILVPAGAWKER